jgi:hypothetical protein
MSFSAEMKDFLTAYKTGQSINASRTDQDYKETQTKAAAAKMERDNDPETLKLATDQARATLDATRQRMGLSAAARGDASKNAALSREIAQERLRQLKAAGTDPGSGLLPPTMGGVPAPGGAAVPQQGALALPPSTLDTGEEAYADGGLVTGNPNDPPARFVREEPKPPVKRERGVLDMLMDKQYETNSDGSAKRDADGKIIPVRRYADGGLVDDEETEDASLPDEAEPTQGVLDTSAPPAGAPTDVSARARTPQAGVNGIISPQLVADAAHAGLTWGVEKAGLHQGGAIKTPAQIRKAQLIAQGAGGLTEPEMAAAKQAVDPDGKLTESQRNMAALGSVYQFYANRNEPDKARRVAFQMMQYYRGASQRYAAIAAKAAESGNMDLATKAALRAYANVPDGKDLEIAPNPDGGLMYTYTDDKGDVIAKGIATPQQLAASAMGLATGGFDKALMTAAGAQPAEAGAVKTGGKPQTATDRAKEAENVGGEVEKLKTAWQAKNKNKPVDEEQWSEMGNVAQHIYQQNPKATANEVARAAHAMLSMGDDPEKPGFKVKPGEDGKPNTVDFGGKMKVQLDDDQLNSILNSRAAKVKAATDKINADMEASDQPSTLDKVGAGALEVGKGIAKVPGEIATLPSKVAGVYGAVGSKVAEVLRDKYGVKIPQGAIDAVDAIIDEGKARYGSSARHIADDANSAAGAIPVDDYGRAIER